MDQMQSKLEAERKRSRDLEQSLTNKELQMMDAISAKSTLERLLQTGKKIYVEIFLT